MCVYFKWNLIPLQKLNFEKVDEFKDAGKKFGQWHNVGFCQKLLKK